MDNNRTERLVCLASPTDAQIIMAAAKDARMTVSTYLLLAALREIGKLNYGNAHIPAENEMDETYSIEKLWSMIEARNAMIYRLAMLVKSHSYDFDEEADWVRCLTNCTHPDAPEFLAEAVKAALYLEEADNANS